MRWVLALLLLAAPAAAQQRNLGALLSFTEDRGATIIRQEVIPDGCAMTVGVFVSLGGDVPRTAKALRLWLGDWLLGDVAPDPDNPEMARLLMLLRHPPSPQDVAFHDSAVLAMEDHLAAMEASGLGFEAHLDEANRMTEEIARRGLAGEFGEFAARNFDEGVVYHPGDMTEYHWEPLGALALRVPADRAADAMVALARQQAAACF